MEPEVIYKVFWHWPSILFHQQLVTHLVSAAKGVFLILRIQVAHFISRVPLMFSRLCILFLSNPTQHNFLMSVFFFFNQLRKSLHFWSCKHKAPFKDKLRKFCCVKQCPSWCGYLNSLRTTETWLLVCRDLDIEVESKLLETSRAI